MRVLKLSCGVQRFLVDTFYDCDMLDHFQTPSMVLRTFVRAGETYEFQLSNDRDTPDYYPHMSITSECLYSISSTQMSEFQLEITEILGQARHWDSFVDTGTWVGASHRLRALVASHESRHKKEVSTLLELGLWKSKMMTDGANLDRELCRRCCGAIVIIAGVMPFI